MDPGILTAVLETARLVEEAFGSLDHLDPHCVAFMLTARVHNGKFDVGREHFKLEEVCRELISILEEMRVRGLYWDLEFFVSACQEHSALMGRGRFME